MIILSKVNQGKIKTNIRMYLRDKGREEEFIKQFTGGYCEGIANLWLLAKTGNYNGFQQSIELLHRFSCGEDLTLDELDEIEHFISHVEFFHRIDNYIYAQQGVIDTILEFIGDAGVKQEYSVAAVFKIDQLKQLLATENLIQEGKMIMVEAHNHATALFKENGKYYYFDSNSKVGQIECTTTDEVAELIVQCNFKKHIKGFGDDDFFPLSLRMFSCDSRHLTYPNKEILYEQIQVDADATASHCANFTSLDMATRVGDIDSVLYFFKKIVALGDTQMIEAALSIAVTVDHINIVKVFIEELKKNTSCDYASSDTQQQYLEMAISHDSVNIAEYFIEELKNTNDFTLIGKKALIVAIEQGRIGIIRMLIKKLENNFDFVSMLEDGLASAISQGRMDVINMLIEESKHTNSFIVMIKNALSSAINDNKPDTARILIEKLEENPECDNNAVKKILEFNLNEAIYNNRVDIARILIEKLKENPELLVSNLFNTARNGKEDITRILIEKLEENPAYDNNAIKEILKSTIHHIAQFNHPTRDMVRMLIEKLEEKTSRDYIVSVIKENSGGSNTKINTYFKEWLENNTGPNIAISAIKEQSEFDKKNKINEPNLMIKQAVNKATKSKRSDDVLVLLKKEDYEVEDLGPDEQELLLISAISTGKTEIAKKLFKTNPSLLKYQVLEQLLSGYCSYLICYDSEEPMSDEEWKNSIKKEMQDGKIDKNADVFRYDKNAQCLYCTHLENGNIIKKEKIIAKLGDDLDTVIKELKIAENNTYVNLNSLQVKIIIAKTTGTQLFNSRTNTVKILVEELIKQNANWWLEPDSEKLLVTTAQTASCTGITKMLIEKIIEEKNRQDVEWINTKIMLAFDTAVKFECVDTIAMLIEKISRITAPDLKPKTKELLLEHTIHKIEILGCEAQKAIFKVMIETGRAENIEIVIEKFIKKDSDRLVSLLISIASVKGCENGVKMLAEKFAAIEDNENKFATQMLQALTTAVEADCIDNVEALINTWSNAKPVNRLNQCIQTELPIAINKGYIDIAKMLIGRLDTTNNSVFIKQELNKSLEPKHINTVAMLITKEACSINDLELVNQKSLLTHAINNGYVAIIKKLVANLNLVDSGVVQEALKLAASKKRNDIVLAMIENGCKISNLDPTSQKSLLLYAINTGKHHDVIKELAEKFVKDSKAQNLITQAINLAIRSEYMDIIKIFQKLDTDNDVITNIFNAAFDEAVESKQFNIVATLVRNNCGINKLDSISQELLTYAINLTKKSKAIDFAEKNKAMDIIVMLVEKDSKKIAELDPDSKQLLMTYAAIIGKKEIIKNLAMEVNVNQADSSGMTVLMHAIENGHIDIIELLIANPDIDINMRAPNQLTALEIAELCEKVSEPLKNKGLYTSIIKILQTKSLINKTDKRSVENVNQITPTITKTPAMIKLAQQHLDPKDLKSQELEIASAINSSSQLIKNIQ